MIPSLQMSLVSVTSLCWRGYRAFACTIQKISVAEQEYTVGKQRNEKEECDGSVWTTSGPYSLGKV